MATLTCPRVDQYWLSICMVVTAYEYQRLLKDYDYSIDVQSIKEKKLRVLQQFDDKISYSPLLLSEKLFMKTGNGLNFLPMLSLIKIWKELCYTCNISLFLWKKYSSNSLISGSLNFWFKHFINGTCLLLWFLFYKLNSIFPSIKYFHPYKFSFWVILGLLMKL